VGVRGEKGKDFGLRSREQSYKSIIEKEISPRTPKQIPRALALPFCFFKLNLSVASVTSVAKMSLRF